MQADIVGFNSIFDQNNALT